MCRIPALALAAALIATAAAAQQPPAAAPAAPARPPAAAGAQRPAPAVTDEVRAAAGAFELTDADERRRCEVTLEAKPQPGSFALVFDKAACAVFPFLGSVAGWVLGPGGSVRLVDAGGRVIADFGETEVGLYETARPGDGVYFLSNHGATATPVPTLADVAGTWAVGRQPGRVICRLTLTDESVGGEGYRVTLAPGCDAAIASFAPASWRIERHDVVLVSPRGDVLRFEKDGKIWRKVPEAGRPLLLSR